MKKVFLFIPLFLFLISPLPGVGQGEERQFKVTIRNQTSYHIELCVNGYFSGYFFEHAEISYSYSLVPNEYFDMRVRGKMNGHWGALHNVRIQYNVALTSYLVIIATSDFPPQARISTSCNPTFSKKVSVTIASECVRGVDVFERGKLIGSLKKGEIKEFSVTSRWIFLRADNGRFIVWWFSAPQDGIILRDDDFWSP